MKLALAMAAVISWIGCGIDTAAPSAGGDDGAGSTGSGSDPGAGGGGSGDQPGSPVTDVSGQIKADTMWMDTIHVVGNLTIDRGVTVTVAPGTTVDVAQGVAISLVGTLDIQGTKAGKVTFQPLTAGDFWAGISIQGALTASYLVETGGSFGVASGATLTLVDSQMSHAGGDLLILDGGTLDMTYSAIGIEATQRDATHCDMHINSAAAIKASHSNISTSAYGLMFYGGLDADFTYDNWFANGIDVSTVPSPPVIGDFSYGYFAKGAPSGSGITATHLVTQRVADAGVR
jgi:hypothetical protein